MSYSLYLKPTWRTRALETSLVWNSKIVLVLNLVLVVQSESPYWLILGRLSEWLYLIFLLWRGRPIFYWGREGKYVLSLRNPVLHQALQLSVCRFVVEIAIRQVNNQAAQKRTLCHCWFKSYKAAAKFPVFFMKNCLRYVLRISAICVIFSLVHL